MQAFGVLAAVALSAIDGYNERMMSRFRVQESMIANDASVRSVLVISIR